MVYAKKADFNKIAEKYDIDPVIARIIRNRDVVGDEAVNAYLNGSLEDLHDPKLLPGAEAAAILLKEKIEDGAKIRVIGDYDIDGVCSTYILYTALTKLGANVDYEIPDRLIDGYGLNKRLIELASQEGTDTILTCDNGISAIDQIRRAKELGMTVIVTDHHEPRFTQENGKKNYLLPPADALADPKVPGSNGTFYPFSGICGAVVAWKVIDLLFRLSGQPQEEILQFLPYAAFATIGDVCDLTDENRIIVKYGLKALEEIENLGMKALIRVTGLEDKPLSAYHIGFILGPCINAGGRLDTAKRSLALLLSRNAEEAGQLANQLWSLNEERKRLTEEGLADAVSQIENTVLKDDKIYVVYLPGTHESIVGIIAGKIRERYNHPAFVLTDARESDMVKGSGRSIEKWNMFEGIQRCADLMTQFGGHAMAAGLTLRKQNLEDFRRQINAECALTEDDFMPRVHIDVPMPLSYITAELIGQLSVLEPCGKGNEKPIFAQLHVPVLSAQILGKNQNVVKFRLSDPGHGSMDALWFGDSSEMMGYLTEKFGKSQVDRMLLGYPGNIELSFTYYPQINEFRGEKNLQIVIRNYF